MKLLFLVLCFFGFSSCSLDKMFYQPKQVFHQYSILQGSTDDTSTVIRVVHAKNLKPIYQVTNNKGDVLNISERKSFEYDESSYQVEHLFIKGLKLGVTYSLSLTNPVDGTKEVRNFKALDGKAKKLKIIVASCMYDAYFDVNEKIWPMVFKQHPDMLFLIGDNIYGDTKSPSELSLPLVTDPKHLWKRHVEHAMSLSLYQSKALVPVFATWDDHDYGINDGDKNFKFKLVSLEIFKSFFPITKNRFLTPNFGTGSVLRLNSHSFFFLDGRSFRDSNKDENGSHLGHAQQELLFSNLEKSSHLNWLIMGDQFFGGYHRFDSFEGQHHQEFKKFTHKLKQMKKRYIFLSGDRHLVELIGLSEEEVGSATFEYTISGVHTKTYPGALARDPNPRRVDGIDGQYNFGVFEIENLNKAKSKIHFKAFTLEGEKISRRDQL